MYYSLILCLLFLFLVYWYFTKNQTYWKDRNIKGPTPLPLFGNLLPILFTSRLQLELDLYKQYGNIYGYFLGKQPVLVVGKLELVKKILVKDFHIFANRRGNASETNHPIMKKNLAQLKGYDWKRIRSMTSPTFTTNKLKSIYPLMVKSVNDFTKHLDDFAASKSNVNLKNIFGNLTLNIIALTHFATDLSSQNELDNVFVKKARDSFQINPIRLLVYRIMPAFVFKMFGLRHDRSEDKEDFYVNLARQILRNRREESGQKINDFLQFLVDAEKSTNLADDGDDWSPVDEVADRLEQSQVEREILNITLTSRDKKLNEDEIIAQIVTFLLAGYETTANTLTHAAYELALNVNAQEKLCDEINVAVNVDGSIDYDVLCRLPYLDAVIAETLRRHPPAIKTNRIALQEYQLEGITLYPGQMVDIPFYAIHHDEKYFPNPFRFDPERFMPENKHNLAPYSYLPFGQGPRKCVGMRFALLEVKLALAHIVRRYKFFPCNDTDVPLVSDNRVLLNAPKRAILGMEMRI